MAGVDHRFKCFVLEGGNLGMTYHLRFTTHPALFAQLKSVPPKALRALLAQVAPFDNRHYIGHAAPAALLFQSATFDHGVSRQELLDSFNAAGKPKEIRWYESGHEMSSDPAAVKDRVEFLARQLGVPSPVPLVLKDMLIAKERPSPSRLGSEGAGQRTQFPRSVAGARQDPARLNAASSAARNCPVHPLQASDTPELAHV